MDVLSIYKSLNTWSCSKYWSNPSKNPFWIFQDFEIFTKEMFPKKFQENSSMSHMTCLMILPISCHGEQYNPMKPSQNHFCPFSSLNIFALSNMSKCSQTWFTSSNGVIMHLYQMEQVGENVILIKVPQNPLWPESNLNKFVLPTFSPWPQLSWACSHDQMRPLHQVVHQGEVICSTRSAQVHFC